MGGEVNIGVSPDRTRLTTDVLSEFAPDAVRLLADLLQNPSLPEEELTRLKRDRLRSLSVQLSQPQSQAFAEFRQVLYGDDHPYGRVFPSQSMLDAYTIDDVTRFYTENFGAKRTHLYVVGTFDAEATETAVRASLGDWKTGPDVTQNPPSPSSERAVHIIDQPGAKQSNVYVGLPVVDPSHEDYVALQVTNSLLGGSFASRITSNIREDKGYTYSPRSTVSTRYRDAYWAEIAAITTEATGPALKEIFYEIDSLQATPPPMEELEAIQNYLAGTFVLQNSSRGGIYGQLSFLDLHGLPDDYLTGYVDAVYNVTPEDVQRVTRDYLRDEDMVIVVAGDRSAVKEQLESFGPIVSDEPGDEESAGEAPGNSSASEGDAR
jgi:predicted Zn-dependent peptidase